MSTRKGCRRRDAGSADGAARVDPHLDRRRARGATSEDAILQTSFLGNQTRVAVACDAVDAPVTASLFGRDRAANGT